MLLASVSCTSFWQNKKAEGYEAIKNLETQRVKAYEGVKKGLATGLEFLKQNSKNGKFKDSKVVYEVILLMSQIINEQPTTFNFEDYDIIIDLQLTRNKADYLRALESEEKVIRSMLSSIVEAKSSNFWIYVIIILALFFVWRKFRS